MSNLRYRLLLLGLLLILAAGTFPAPQAAAMPRARTFSQLLAIAVQQGQLPPESVSAWQVRSIVAPETLPDFLRPAEPEPSASLLLRHLHRSTRADASLSRLAAQRPSLPAEEIYDTDHFRVHYTLVGPDAVGTADRNGNHIPDYVEFLATTAEKTWATMHRQLQWPRPQHDAPRGGDDRTDVYLLNLQRVYLAYTEYDESSCADNSATPAIETAACSAFMVMSNDMSGLSVPPLALVRVTFAHEYMHVLQFGIDSNETADWLWEGWAVWSEDRVFDEINLYLDFLPPLFQNPDAPLDEHPYAMALLPMWLDQHVSPELVRDVWLRAATKDGMDAVAAALQARRLRLRPVLQQISVALTNAAACPAATPYCWRDGDKFPRVSLEGRMQTASWFSQKQGNGRLAPYAQDILMLALPAPGRLELRSPAIGHLALQVVAFYPDSDLPLRVLPSQRADDLRYVDIAAPRNGEHYLAIVSTPDGVGVASYELHWQTSVTPIPQDFFQLYLPQISRLTGH